MPSFRVLLLGGALALAVGCSKDIPRASVSGKVTYLTKPVNNGTITFVNEKAGVAETAKIANGEYKIERAPVGEVKVTVVTPAPPSAMQMKQKVGDKAVEAGSEGRQLQVPGKYSNPDTSGLTYTVTVEKSQTHNIGLR